MKKKVVINASPDLKQAAKRNKKEPIVFVRDNLVVPSKLALIAENKKYYIRTYGCQANVLDGQTIEGILREIGYTPVENELDADIVILNTCAIRENAEDKVFGEIGSLKALKNKNPEAIIGICGCMTQQPHIVEKIQKTYPQVDLIFGTHNIHHLPQLILESIEKNVRIVEVYSKEGEVIENMPCHRSDKIKAFVNIMYGCDKFCTYCIVPYTRGKQRSRVKEDIIKECEALVKEGYQEITLLGQNVNAYGKDLTEGGCTFGELLQEVAKLGIPRLRFTTSHPWDFTEEMFKAMGTYPNIMPFIHLPLQSGSDDVLRRMGRRYTSKDYKALVDRLREILPHVAISTDLIVGFPNDSDQDFEDTLDVVRYVKYDSAFTFIYSPRVGTPGASMEDKIPHEVKQARFKELVKVLAVYEREKAEAYVGKVIPVLVEGTSKKDKSILSGYSDTNKLVNFKGDYTHVGKIVNVKITEATTYYLKGEEVNE